MSHLESYLSMIEPYRASSCLKTKYFYRITDWVNNSNLPVLKILKKELREQKKSG